MTSSPAALAGERVERAGGFIGEDQAAVANERAGDRDALLLPAGHLVGIAVGELVQAQLVQGADGGAMGLAHPTAVELERQADVLGGGK